MGDHIVHGLLLDYAITLIMAKWVTAQNTGVGGWRKGDLFWGFKKIISAANNRNSSTGMYTFSFPKFFFHANFSKKKCPKKSYKDLRTGWWRNFLMGTYRRCKIPRGTRRRRQREQFCWLSSSRITEIHTFRPIWTELSFSLYI